MAFFVFPDSDGLFADGTVALPGIAFRAQPSSGFFRVSDGVIGVSGAGLEVVRFSAPGGATPQVLLADGAVATPALAFASTPIQGIWKSAATAMAFTQDVSVSYPELRRIAGHQYALTIGGASASSVGLYVGVAGQQVYASGRQSTAATAGFVVNNGGASYTGSSTAQVGTQLDYSLNQTNTAGFTHLLLTQTQTAIGSGTHRFFDARVGASTHFAIASDATMPGQVQGPAGTAARPTYAFHTSTNNGFFLAAANSIGVATSGTEFWRFAGATLSGFQSNSIISAPSAVGRITIQGNIQNSASGALSVTSASSWTGGAGVLQAGIDLIATINQTSSAAFSGLRMNLTQTALGSGEQRFMDLQVAGTTRLAITSDATMPGQIQATLGSTTRCSYSFLSFTNSGMWYDGAAGTLNFNAAGTTYLVVDDGAAAVKPSIDAAISSGALGFRWSDLFAVTTTIGDLVMRDPHAKAKRLAPDQIAHWKLIEGLDGIWAYNIRTGEKYELAMKAAKLEPGDTRVIEDERSRFQEPQPSSGALS